MKKIINNLAILSLVFVGSIGFTCANLYQTSSKTNTVYAETTKTITYTDNETNYVANSLNDAYSALTNGGVISLSSGTYSEDELITTFNNGKTYTIRFDGDVTINVGSNHIFNISNSSNVTFETSDGSSVNINGSNNNGIPFFVTGSNLILNGDITINELQNSSFYGVAVHGSNANISLNGITFKNCVSNWGGAVSSESNKSLVINNCKFLNNSASVAGALYVNGGNLTINDSIFDRNTATATSGLLDGASGGAMAIYNCSPASITNTIISNNKAIAGAGLLIVSSDVTLNSGTKIENNTTTNWGASAAYINSKTLTMNEGASISNNTANEGGTIIVKGTGAEFIMNGGEIYGNTANYSNKDGGAAVLLSQSGAKFTMNGGSIHDNTSKYGSAVTAENQATVNLNGGSISNNTCLSGTNPDINTKNMTLTVDINNLVKDITTKTSLSFGYEILEDNNYNFFVNSNNTKKDGFVGLRFGVMIPTGIWNMIKTEVKAIGIEYSKLGGTLGSQQVLTNDVMYANESGLELGNAYAAFSLRMIIDVNSKDIDSTGRGYILKNDDTKIYLGETRSYSIKSLCEDYISKSSSLNLSETTIEALNTLSGKEASN